MNDFFSKLENFFFDILGLILPGAVFLLILLSPVLFVDMGRIGKIADTSVVLSALVTIWTILKTYWASNPKSVLTIIAILAYLIGHTIKVFSRIKYEFLTAFFDKFIDKWVERLYNKCRDWVFPSKTSKTYLQLKELFSPFKSLISAIFTFDIVYYTKSDEAIRQNCLDQLDDRLGMDISRDKYSIVKISSVITNQENLRSLGTFFLAKYNLYRSLALIFLFTIFYYLCFFRTVKDLLTGTSQELSHAIIMVSILLWFTFHAKYKRYWTFYGSERLITLFYFLNKKKINERG